MIIIHQTVKVNSFIHQKVNLVICTKNNPAFSEVDEGIYFKMNNEKRFSALAAKGKLRALRREFGLSQQEAADKIGIALTRYRYFEESYNDEYLSAASDLHTLGLMEAFFDMRMAKDGNTYLDEGEIERTDLSFKIIRQRKKLGDSQQDLSDVLRVDVMSVISWESGERAPNDRCTKMLVDYLEIDENA